MFERPKWYQVFGIVVYDIILIVAGVFLIMNNHPWFALLLILFISDGDSFGIHITWKGSDKD